MNSSPHPRTPGVLSSLKLCHLLALLGFIIFLLVWTPPSVAGSGWQRLVEQKFIDLLGEVESEQQIFVSHPIDSTREGSYYPFLHTTLREVLMGAAANRGYSILEQSSQADLYVNTEFRAGKNFLTLSISLQDASTRKMIGSKLVRIDGSQLPADWKERSLRDIAVELTTKLDNELFGQQALSVVVGEFSVGKSKTDTYVSEFSNIMRGYIREELGRLDTFRVQNAESSDTGTNQLQGHFQVMGKEVLLRLWVFKPSSGREIANSSARIPIEIIPSGVSIYPENLEALEAEEIIDDVPDMANSVEQSSQEKQLIIWTNHEDLDRTYKDGQELVLYLRPSMNLYVRIYYIQSDATILQIFPCAPVESGFLKGNHQHRLPRNGITYRITDTTIGQETIKVFTSLAPIDDSRLPVEFSSGNKDQCVAAAVTSSYRGLKDALTRGLNLEYEVRPEAEIKILVTR